MRASSRLLIGHLRSLAEQGKTLAQVAAETEMRYNYICKLAGAHDIVFTRQRMADRPEAKLRAVDMRRRYEDGETLEIIGQRYGLTRERVRQILTKRFGTNAKDGGQAERARRKRREFHKKRDARSIKSWGCNYRQYRSILKHPGKPTYCFSQQRKNADQRGIGWELSLWQWWKIWEQSGHWPERGNGKGYCMCRLNDVGPYAVDNVYIATGTDNMKDHWVKRRAAEALEAAGIISPIQFAGATPGDSGHCYPPPVSPAVAASHSVSSQQIEGTAVTPEVSTGNSVTADFSPPQNPQQQTEQNHDRSHCETVSHSEAF